MVVVPSGSFVLIKNQRLFGSLANRGDEILESWGQLVQSSHGCPDETPLDSPGVGAVQVGSEKGCILTGVGEREEFAALTDFGSCLGVGGRGKSLVEGSGDHRNGSILSGHEAEHDRAITPSRAGEAAAEGLLPLRRMRNGDLNLGT